VSSSSIALLFCPREPFCVCVCVIAFMFFFVTSHFVYLFCVCVFESFALGIGVCGVVASFWRWMEL
jgi:hypothetical protein